MEDFLIALNKEVFFGLTLDNLIDIDLFLLLIAGVGRLAIIGLSLEIENRSEKAYITSLC